MGKYEYGSIWSDYAVHKVLFIYFLAELKPCAMECTWQDYQGTTERGEKLLCSKALSCAVFVFQCAHFGLKETMNKAGNA